MDIPTELDHENFTTKLEVVMGDCSACDVGLLNIQQVHLNNPPKVPGLNAPNPKRASFWIPAKSTS